MARTRNARLAAVIAETGWSQQQVAAHFVRVAVESDARELLGTGRSHVSMWVLGSRPTGRAPSILCETLSRKLQRPLTLREIGLATDPGDEPEVPEWSTDTLTTLADLGSEDLDMERRQILATTTYSLAGLALPGASWWNSAPDRARDRPATSRRTVTAGDLADIREVTEFFSRRDQQRGGGVGRSALVAYLRAEGPAYLGGRFRDERVRRDTYSAVAEMAYLSGWMAFDASQHRTAQRYLTLAVRLAAEADDAPLSGHILRAMAHQAVDLGHPGHALDLAAASVDGHRYTQASPREKALLAVVHARSLAAAGRKKEALTALLRAENDLDAARDRRDDEPSRVFFFSEASLAHETACALRDLGDLDRAQTQFRRSVRTRQADAFSRTHAVTLGYLGAVQARQGNIEVACTTWHQALDTMDGVQSGRARDTVAQMRSLLTPFRRRGVTAVSELDARARDVLGRVA